MPSALTFPGVYVEEIPSGVRTIIGVATSVTAFIGRALRGPADEAVVINSFGDFERIFGDLWRESSLGFAVRDFYLNGGSQAIVVRVYALPTGGGSGKAAVNVGGLTLEAANEGKWGNTLGAKVDQDVSAEVAVRFGLDETDLFNLAVQEVAPDGQVVTAEVFRNLTVKESPRRVDRVLKDDSQLARWKGSFPTTLPTLTAGTDALTALATLKQASKVAKDATPPVPATIDAAKKAVTEAEDALKKALTDAETALTSAKAALKVAEDATPPVPATIDAAKKAVTEAQTALDAVPGNGGSNGQPLGLANFLPSSGQANKKGLYSLEKADIFNILCLPPYTATEDVDPKLVTDAAVYCEAKRAMLLVDPVSTWDTVAEVIAGIPDVGTNSKNAAFFFPRLSQPNPLRDNKLENFVPCGAVAGIFARTDSQRGVWKAPAGLDATLVGVPKLSVPLTNAENGQLNPLGVNCLRTMPAAGRVVWGARTLQGNDRLASEWKYIPVRRTALFIEETLYRALQWVVFEPNDEPLWSQIRLNVGAFMNTLFRQGAFQGSAPRDAYFVKCDKDTTTQNDIDRGIVNILVGFAPLKPAEFVIIKLQQIAGQIQT